MKFICPHCGKMLNVSDQSVGKKGKCPGCGGLIVIPPTPAENPCPGCEADLPDNSVVCIQCGFDRRTGSKIVSEGKKKPEGKPDQAPLWIVNFFNRTSWIPAVVAVGLLLGDYSLKGLDLRTLYDSAPPDILIRDISQYGTAAVNDLLRNVDMGIRRNSSDYLPSASDKPITIDAPKAGHTHLVIAAKNSPGNDLESVTTLLSRYRVEPIPAGNQGEIPCDGIVLAAGTKDRVLVMSSSHEDGMLEYCRILSEKKDARHEGRTVRVAYKATENFGNTLRQALGKESYLGVNVQGTPYLEKIIYEEGAYLVLVMARKDNVYPVVVSPLQPKDEAASFKNFSTRDNKLKINRENLFMYNDGHQSFIEYATSEGQRVIVTDPLPVSPFVGRLAPLMPAEKKYYAMSASEENPEYYYNGLGTLVFLNVPCDRKYALTENGNIRTTFNLPLTRYSSAMMMTAYAAFVLIAAALGVGLVIFTYKGLKFNPWLTLGMGVVLIVMETAFAAYGMAVVKTSAVAQGDILSFFVQAFGFGIIILMLLSAGVITKRSCE
ncbi:MAG: zinc ribbon domain-containing protein [Phycisphaerae bacterium]